MGKIVAAAVTLVVALFLVGLLTPIVSADPAEVTAPHDWSKGEQWGLGWDYSLNVKNNDTVNQALAENLSQMTGLTFEEASVSVDANAAVYVLFEVKGVTADSYVLGTKLAIKLEADASVSATGMLPQAGTYPAPYGADPSYGSGPAEASASSSWLDGLLGGSSFNYTGIPTAERTVSAGLSADFALIVDGTTVLDRTTLAVESVDLHAKGAAMISLGLKNLPQFDRNDTTSTRTVAYANYNLGLRAAVGLDLSVGFTPALDLFQFPFNVTDPSWTARSEANVTGDVDGFVDVSGLTPEMDQQLFGPAGPFNGTGITGFPVKLDQLTDQDGKFGPYSDNVTATVTCENGDNGTYALSVDYGDGQFLLNYSTVQEFLTGMAIPFDLGDQAGDSPMAGLAFPGFELKAVSPSTAQSNIDSIGTYEQQVENRAQTNSVVLTDFFFDPPYTGLILVIVAAIVVGGALFMVTRTRKPKV